MSQEKFRNENVVLETKYFKVLENGGDNEWFKTIRGYPCC